MVEQSGKYTWLRRLFMVLNVVFHQMIAVVFVYILTIIFSNYDPKSLDTWHVILCATGFLVIMTEGIILFGGENVFAIDVDRATKAKIHSIILCCGTIMITIGVGFKIASFEKYGLKHFTSYHGVLGLTAWLLTLASVVLGAFSSNAAKLKSIAAPVLFKLVHNLVGILAYILGIACIGTGLFKDMFKSLSNESLVGLAVVALIHLGVLSMLRAFKSAYQQVKSLLGKS